MARSSWRDLTERHLATAAPRSILLIEDDDVYVERVRDALLAAHPTSFKLEVSRTLSHAENALQGTRYDLVLLDLGLPDEHGMRSFERVHRAAGTQPVVIITSSDDPDLAARLLYLGAHDYLVKGASDELLLHVVGRAISRSAPDAGRLPVIEPDPEMRAPLQERSPEEFESLVGEYLSIVGLAVHQRIVRGATVNYREPLRVLAEQFGRADAGARDALLVHTEAVRRQVVRSLPDLDSWVNESRLVALELLAQLTEHYRDRAIRTR